MESFSAIHLAIMERTESVLVKCAPHILIRESHNASILAMYNSFHNIVRENMRSATAIFMPPTEAIMGLPQIPQS